MTVPSSQRPPQVGVQALLAESVAVADGRLFVHGGGWAHMQVPSLPAQPGRLGIGLLLSVPAERAGEPISLLLRVDGPDGQPVALSLDPDTGALRSAHLEGTLVAEPPPPDSPLECQIVPLAFNVDGVRLEAPGLHVLVVDVDGKPAARVPFAVMLEPPAS